ncbi:unnamed protein product [Rotaria sp. Silwood2]|nr:unnamed protein product [Rotaria sp. Silwood2]CAF4317365.1 unnamed protein product [Rotaria sp. Silwood2]CAF4480616.1 unnamed protein product [Rotaria sp. Silwood2]
MNYFITSVSYGAWAGSYLFVENPVTYEISSPNLSGYRNKVGHMYSFIVTGTIVGSVWGTDIYTDDSNLATAAVHAGVANNNETKVVHIKILPGQSSYEGTIRNGVTSLPFDVWKGSYTFANNTINPGTALSTSPVCQGKAD